jgi:glutathione gamma-glutamylcysteinyltransferase
MEGWFALSEQFHTQSDPAFCGLGTLVVALNALEIDPGRVWKGPWRWYGEELLDCCLPLEQVRERGVTLDQLACLARCNGAHARIDRADEASADALREAVRNAAHRARGQVVVAGYSRKELGQTGDGHYSPIGGYHAARDLALVLDVARFKYPPHWVPIETLHRAMRAPDPATGRARGFIVLERSPFPAALFFRVLLEGDLAGMKKLLFEEIPASLAAPDPRSCCLPLDPALQDRLCTALAPLRDTRAELVPEHRALVDALLEDVRRTRAYAHVRDASACTAELCAETISMLLLALPDHVVAGLGDDERHVLAPLRDGAVGESLEREVAVLREQLTMLVEWR